MQNWFVRLLSKLRELKTCGLMSKPSCGLWSSVLEDFHQLLWVCPILCQEPSQSTYSTTPIPIAGRTAVLTLADMTRALCDRVQTESSFDQLPSSWPQLPFEAQILLQSQPSLLSLVNPPVGTSCSMFSALLLSLGDPITSSNGQWSSLACPGTTAYS